MDDWKHEDHRRALHALLRNGTPAVASQLAKAWGCHERTIRRALTKMRDEDHLPVLHDRIAGTWRYTAEVGEIPATLVSAENRRALLFSLQAAAQFEGTPVCAQIRDMYERLLATLPPERATDFKRMMESVRFVGPSIPTIKKDVWVPLLLCLEANETLNIIYTDAVYGSTTTRDVDPFGLIMRDRRWLLVAFCHRAGAVLTFSPQRITAASCTDRKFKKPAGFMDRYMANSFDGWQSSGDKVKVTLRIAKPAPPYVHDRQWSANEKRRLDAQGNVIIEFQASALFAIEREVRAEAGFVELLEPASSRETLRKTAQTLARRHR